LKPQLELHTLEILLNSGYAKSAKTVKPSSPGRWEKQTIRVLFKFSLRLRIPGYDLVRRAAIFLWKISNLQV
jgi:hypothetical protein